MDIKINHKQIRQECPSQVPEDRILYMECMGFDEKHEDMKLARQELETERYSGVGG